MKKTGFAVKAATFGIIAGIVVFLGRYIYIHWSDIISFDWRINYQLFMFSLLLLCIPFLMMAVGWHLILRLLSCVTNPLDSIRVYTLSQFARYIPGNVFILVGRAVLAERIGVKRSISSVSVFIEAILSTSGAYFAILILYCFSTKIKIQWLNPVWTGLLIGTGLLMLNPKLIKFLLRKIHTKINKRGGEVLTLNFTYSQVLLVCLFYILIWILVGISFYFFLSSLLGNIMGGQSFFDVSAIYLISWIVGFLSFITPGGIGVREGVLTLGLGQFLPLYLVSVIAIIARIWFTVGEMLGTVIAHLLPRKLNGISLVSGNRENRL